VFATKRKKIAINYSTILHLLNYFCRLNLKSENTGLGCSSMVQHLPSMREALGSIPAPKKKRQKKKKKRNAERF
jgi:hypothetical protein